MRQLWQNFQAWRERRRYPMSVAEARFFLAGAGLGTMCDIEGCGQSGQWWIYKMGSGLRLVCGDCKPEMEAVMGWRPASRRIP